MCSLSWPLHIKCTLHTHTCRHQTSRTVVYPRKLYKKNTLVGIIIVHRSIHFVCLSNVTQVARSSMKHNADAISTHRCCRNLATHNSCSLLTLSVSARHQSACRVALNLYGQHGHEKKEETSCGLKPKRWRVWPTQTPRLSCLRR